MSERRLAAILVADVVGYSKLIGSDEAGTLAQASVPSLPSDRHQTFSAGTSA